MKFCGSQVPVEAVSRHIPPTLIIDRGLDLSVRFSLIVFHFMESNGD